MPILVCTTNSSGKRFQKGHRSGKGDASHLLGFSVTAAGNRVNAGELDLPQ